MDIPTKIKMAEAYAKMSESDLARRLGKTPQSFGQRMKTGKFSFLMNLSNKHRHYC